MIPPEVHPLVWFDVMVLPDVTKKQEFIEEVNVGKPEFVLNVIISSGWTE